jgi:hypothetical protein
MEEEKKNESNSESSKFINNDLREYIDINSLRLISKKYFIFIFLILIIYLFSYIFFLIFWIIYYNKIKSIFNIITNDTLASCVGYNLLAIGQIMILGNLTIDEFSDYLEYDGNYFQDEYQKALTYLFAVEYEEIKKINDLFKNQKDLLQLNCNDFLEKIQDSRINSLISDYPEYKFRENYPHLCNFLSFFEYNDEKIIYKEVFFQINQIYNIIKDANRTYESLIKIWSEKNIFNLSIYQHLYFRPYRTWKNYKILDNAIDESLKIIDFILIIHLMVFIFIEIIIFILIQCYLFRSLDKMIKIITNCRNVFRIIK